MPSSYFEPPTLASITRVHASLLQWYAAEQRNLPWRCTANAYHVLVSEIMLQQTQVERVLPKYTQFLAAFPTLSALAQAPTADVIATWVPLGYNRRAVSLQAIARQVLAEYDGRIPDSIDELLKLKGIGRYTAGAIACFAYHQQVATVDTNIRRVLHRVFLGLEHPEPKIRDAQMLTLAEQVLPTGKAYNWNQALMDLGATICTSANPQCMRCPLQSTCLAFEEMSLYSLFPSGTVLRQLRKVAEKKPSYQAQPFTSTNRYFRGRVVDVLRTIPGGDRLPLSILGSRIKPNFHDDDLPWLQALVSKLAKDGLVNYS
ncbi:MAG TPA: A/G-specific adenine glycosylase, partial [Ktedonobacteraceae bacterium]|nr:A/G-specific adenine glycosylase [Ktedonobacteraceae bacterium]